MSLFAEGPQTLDFANASADIRAVNREEVIAHLRALKPRLNAEQLRQGYIPGREAAATVAVTTLVTGLAMNHVQRGSYLP